MAATERTLRLQRRLERDLKKITDTRIRALVSAWADAWSEVEPDLTTILLDMLTSGKRVTRSQMLRSARLQHALIIISYQLERLAAEAGVQIVGDLRQVIDQAGAAQASVIDSQLPPRSGLLDDLEAWSYVDERQLTEIVRRSTEQITSRTQRLSRDAQAVVRRELIRGVAAGSNPRVTARRIVTRTERGFNGGLSRALNIARTETLDAHRVAAALGQAQHADVLTGWIWLADLSSRICPSCLGMHGSMHPLDEQGPMDHPQGRCSRMPVVKPWAELGFDIPEPPSLVPDGGSWFGGLDDATQREILGPTRHAAYADGVYPMASWAERRTTPGWRDSYVVSKPPPALGRRRRAA